MYLCHSDQDGAKNVLKALCFAGKKTIWLCERYKVLGNTALYCQVLHCIKLLHCINLSQAPQKRKSHPKRAFFFCFFARRRTWTHSSGTVRWTVPATSANTGGYLYFLPTAENANQVLPPQPTSRTEKEIISQKRPLGRTWTKTYWRFFVILI